MGAAVRACPTGTDTSDGGGAIFRVRGGGDPGYFEGDLFIGIEGARRVQMRCGFRLRDRDRTTERMEGV